MRAMLLLFALSSCDVGNPIRRDEAPCDERTPWYPIDGSDQIYVSCEDPGEGWTREPPPLDTDDS